MPTLGHNLARPRVPLGCAVALVFAGCSSPPQTVGQLSDRLGNANQIRNPAAKDDALSGIAQDAATAGQPALSLAAVDGIAALAARDLTAEACANTFNGLGDRGTAEAMVGRISNVATQDRIRQAYAREPAPTSPPPADRR